MEYKVYCLYYTGRTALHWAAAVNNVDAVRILLKNNANRDAQDGKVLLHSQTLINVCVCVFMT